jgi:hypothetical protein
MCFSNYASYVDAILEFVMLVLCLNPDFFTKHYIQPTRLKNALQKIINS